MRNIYVDQQLLSSVLQLRRSRKFRTANVVFVTDQSWMLRFPGLVQPSERKEGEELFALVTAEEKMRPLPDMTLSPLDRAFTEFENLSSSYVTAGKVLKVK